MTSTKQRDREDEHVLRQKTAETMKQMKLSTDTQGITHGKTPTLLLQENDVTDVHDC